MILSDIERFILQIVGHKRYSELSVSKDADDIEDFSFLHRCVNLARDEIRLGTQPKNSNARR